MSSREIGKITSVGIRGVVADVNADLGNYINTIDGILFVGEVGSYVSIYEIGRTIIAEIYGVDEKTQPINTNELTKPISKRQVYLNLIGEIVDDKFFFGVSKMPLIFSTVYMISQKELTTMLEVGNEELPIASDLNKTRAVLLSIGKSVIFPDYEVKVNIDKFFGFHFAVFGNTGAGKSNTIARILQNVFMKKNYSAKGAKFVIIDSNGEYNKAFSKLSDINPQIKHFLMATDELNNNGFKIPVSQRPSELSKTVVSQCSNFIVHRVQNPDDLQYISKMVPYINQNMIDRLTYLQTGNALVFGSAINLPTLTKFEQADPTTDSDNAKISEKWYHE